MEVTFETTQGRRFTVEIWYFSTVRRIKEYILKQEAIPVESQRLFFQGQELDDDRDTHHYPIVQGSHVLIVLPDDSPTAAAAAASDDGRASASPVLVRVVASGPALGPGRSVALELDASCTVARLKEMLQERTDGAAKVSVFFGKAEMEDDKALAEFDPPAEGMEVRVVVRQPPPPMPVCTNGNGVAAANKINNMVQQQQRMSVEVKWGGKTATLEVSDTDAVKELRAELGSAAPHLLLPNDGAYFFIYKQNVMDEDRTLRWHDVKTGDTIEIFNGRVTGGV